MGRGVLAITCLLLVAACEPDDRRPGLWLSGEVEASLPDDWSFTRDHPEIHIEVSTPYLLPHSVTIWCVDVDGALYVGARAPESKRWPGWVDDDPEVRLEIAGRIYPVRLLPLTSPVEIAPVAQAFAAKYRLPATASDATEEEVGQRYWRVAPRG
jgi:hypothetical protein